MSAEALIQHIFETRNAAHVEHWKTKSYAQHAALGDFYEGIVEKIDAFVEARQGLYGAVGKTDFDTKDIKAQIQKELLWILENRSAICGNVPALENIYDELSALYMTTLFKLERLK
jgi:hypothetical protein